MSQQLTLGVDWVLVVGKHVLLCIRYFLIAECFNECKRAASKQTLQQLLQLSISCAASLHGL